MKRQNTTQMPLRIPKSLHRELKQASQGEGISLNQYCLYLLTKNIPSVRERESKKLKELLKFVAQAHVFQDELVKQKKTSAPLPPEETPLERLTHLYAHH